MARCEPGCTCGRHNPEMLARRAARISEAKAGRPLTEAHRAALTCAPGCTCAKHALRNAGQFQPGSAGFTGTHSDETRAKLAAYRGPAVSSYKHGQSGTPTYSTWSSMHSRCSDPRNASWNRYGGRGIAVCPQWSDFLVFLADMGPRPSLDHSIDRRDGDGNYEPSNCRWATREEQNANRTDPGGWAARRAK